MKKTKRKTRKKNLARWLSPVLFGVLALLLAVLLWPNHSQYDVAQQLEFDAPVYEDIQVAPPHVDEVKPKPIAPKVEDKKIYQYNALKQHGIALIIDDVGYDLSALKRILNLGLPVAISIIPDAPYAKEAAEMAHQAGSIVMLHMPMEPANPHYRDRMDDSFLRDGMSEQTVQSMLQQGLDKVPYVQGINNHMGSFLTSMPEPMAWVMKFCQDHQLFFIDSKTSSKSVAADVAASYGLVWGARRVFLDHSVKEGEIKQAWLSAERYAKRQGGCIVIGHPHPETLDFLEWKVAHAKPKTMRFVVDLLHVPKG